METYQHTLKKEVTIRGIGLHSGRPVTMQVLPAGANSGIRFLRKDVSNGLIPAFMSRVVDTRLATTLGTRSATVSTTEHILAALSGLGIDNALIALDGPEVPIMDGSAAPFAYILRKVGLQKQKSRRLMLRITREIGCRNGGKLLRVLPYDGLKLTCEIDFAHDTIGKQSYTLEVNPKNFAEQIASARTFGFLDEVEMLKENGLALGGSLDNAVVVDQYGVLNREGLRFADEFARHKVLDLLGDLALLGFPLLGHVIAYKPGHEQHLKFMQEIAANPDCWEYIECGTNGDRVLERVAMCTKSAGSSILPYFMPTSRAFASDLCAP